MSITVKQFQEVLENGVEYEYTPWNGTESETESYDENDFWHEAEDGGPYVIPGFGTLAYVDGEHGGEGSAEHIWQVWSVTDDEGNKQYFQKTGYYASYDGSNWDGSLYEVEPFEKTVTAWRNVK